jgi:hypothetical protein
MKRTAPFCAVNKGGTASALVPYLKGRVFLWNIVKRSRGMEEAWIFGDRLEHVHYIVRRGAYAVIINDGMVAVVKTPTGYFLPGGGGRDRNIGKLSQA